MDMKAGNKVWFFEKLSPEAKAVAVEAYRYHFVNYSGWDACIIGDCKTRLADVGFLGADIRYSGFCSQGDGASFTCDSLDYGLLWDTLADQFSSAMLRRKAAVLYVLSGYVSSCVERHSSRYCHENTCKVDWCLETGSELQKIEQCLETFFEAVEALRLDMCQDCYTALEEEYNHITSDEAVTENLIANEYRFSESGGAE